MAVSLFQNKFFKMAGILGLVLIAFRLCLPMMVLRYVNGELSANADYRGHVEDIDISLWRGAYQLKRLKLDKLGGALPVPYFSCEVIDLAIEWEPLMYGTVVGKVYLYKPVINFVNGSTDAKSQIKIDNGWKDTAHDIMPLTVNHCVVEDGELHYRDYESHPQVELALSQIKAVITNLRNVKELGKPLPATVVATANCFDSGRLDLRIALDAMKPDPTFELKETLNGAQLVKMNDFFEAYGGFTVKAGTFDLVTELAAQDGGFVGYAKPFLRDFEVETRRKDPLKQLWAGLVSVVTSVLSNPQTEQIATKVPMKGTFSKTEIDVWTSIGGLVRNAFFQALLPSLDGAIHLLNVKRPKPGKKAAQNP